MKRIFKKKRLLQIGLSLVASLLGLLLLEGLFRILPQEHYDPGELDPGLIEYDQRLGWTHRPNWTGAHHHRDFQATYSVNHRGLRADPASDRKAPASLVLGDSFTFGVGVEDEETFSALLNQSVPDQRFLNAGITGYSTDQQLLFLEKLKITQPYASLLWIVYLGNDLADNPRAYPLQAAQAKPYFQLRSEGGLHLQNVPVPMEKRTSHLDSAFTRLLLEGVYQPSRIHRILAPSVLWQRIVTVQRNLAGYPKLDYEGRFSEDLKLFQAIIERGHESAIPLTVVLIPGRTYVETPSAFAGQYTEHLRRQLLKRDWSASIQVIDAAKPMQEHFRENPRQSLFFPNEGHFNPDGHRWLADFLLAEFR